MAQGSVVCVFDYLLYCLIPELTIPCWDSLVSSVGLRAWLTSSLVSFCFSLQFLIPDT